MQAHEPKKPLVYDQPQPPQRLVMHRTSSLLIEPEEVAAINVFLPQRELKLLQELLDRKQQAWEGHAPEGYAEGFMRTRVRAYVKEAMILKTLDEFRRADPDKELADLVRSSKGDGN